MRGYYMIKRDTQRDTPTFMEKEPQKRQVFSESNHSALLGASLLLHVTGYYFNFSADMRGLTPKLRPRLKVLSVFGRHTDKCGESERDLSIQRHQNGEQISTISPFAVEKLYFTGK